MEGPRRHRPDEIPVEVQVDMGARAREGRLGRPGLSGRTRRSSATLTEQVAFHEEYVRSEAPARLGNIGVTLLGPTLLAFASDEQQQRFVPPILRCDELWCQGYSEPDAGSDLASLRTHAGARWRRVGDRRTEGVDDARSPRAMVLRTVPHRPCVAASRRSVVLVGADGSARHRSAADPSAHRQQRVQRVVLPQARYASGSRRRRGRGRRGRNGDVGIRARRRFARACNSRSSTSSRP